MSHKVCVCEISSKKYLNGPLCRTKLGFKRQFLFLFISSNKLQKVLFLKINYVIVHDSLKMCYVYIHTCNHNEPLINKIKSSNHVN